MLPPIVDMRNRPSWLHKFFGSTPGTPEYDVVRWLNKRVGTIEIDHFTKSPTLDKFIAEMDDAAISVAVMVARSTPTVRVENEDVAAVAKSSNGRLLGVASVDPQLLGEKKALQQAEHAIKDLGHYGLNIDAAFYQTALKADDRTRAVPVVGFYSHVETALRRSALEAGIDEALPRSAFTQRLPELLSGRPVVEAVEDPGDE